MPCVSMVMRGHFPVICLNCRTVLGKGLSVEWLDALQLDAETQSTLREMRERTAGVACFARPFCPTCSLTKEE